MTKVRFTTEVTLKNGRIARSVPIGFENATATERVAIDAIKPLMKAWLKSKIAAGTLHPSADILVRSKYAETSTGLTIEFKVHSVVSIG